MGGWRSGELLREGGRGGCVLLCRTHCALHSSNASYIMPSSTAYWLLFTGVVVVTLSVLLLLRVTEQLNRDESNAERADADELQPSCKRQQSCTPLTSHNLTLPSASDILRATIVETEEEPRVRTTTRDDPPQASASSQQQQQLTTGLRSRFAPHGAQNSTALIKEVDNSEEEASVQEASPQPQSQSQAQGRTQPAESSTSARSEKEEELLEIADRLLALLATDDTGAVLAFSPSSSSHASLQRALRSFRRMLHSLSAHELQLYSASVCSRVVERDGLDALQWLAQQRVSHKDGDPLRDVSDNAEFILHTLVPLVWSA